MKRQKLKRDASDYNKKFRDKNSDDSGGEETELLPRRSHRHETPSTEITIEEGDTLQALSIRYNCSVAELKRLNHIHNDNEIFAKRTFKVPYRPFSAILAGVHNSGGGCSPVSKPKVEQEEVNAEVLETKLHTFLSVPGSHADHDLSSFNEVIFNSKIASKACDNASDGDESENSSDEQIHLLPSEAEADVKVTAASKYFCNETDILWIALFCCVVVFAIPIIRMVYVSEHNNSTAAHSPNHIS